MHKAHLTYTTEMDKQVEGFRTFENANCNIYKSAIYIITHMEICFIYTLGEIAKKIRENFVCFPNFSHFFLKMGENFGKHAKCSRNFPRIFPSAGTIFGDYLIR